MAVNTHSQKTLETFKRQHLSIPEGAKNQVNFLERVAVRGLTDGCFCFGVRSMSFKTGGVVEAGVGEVGIGGLGRQGLSGRLGDSCRVRPGRRPGAL